MNYKYASLALLSTLFLIYMSSIPDKSLWGGGSLIMQIISNLAHIPAYALLTFFWLKVFKRRKERNQFIIINVLILIGLVLFAVSDEIHQSFVPGRTASCMDVGLNIVGILFGIGLFSARGKLGLLCLSFCVHTIFLRLTLLDFI